MKSDHRKKIFEIHLCQNGLCDKLRPFKTSLFTSNVLDFPLRKRQVHWFHSFGSLVCKVFTVQLNWMSSLKLT